MSTPRSIDAGIGIGEIFLEKYRVDAILGQGGMGVVAMCTHLALNECVAIKMLRRDVLDDVEAVERFMREAQAASKLKSEYVARVTDVGRSSANVPYMVMEYLEGHDLGQLLEERGKIALPWAVELTLQACEALAEAHSIGIVHRDVKPNNLFVTWRPDGSALIKVLDFGISKAPVVEAMQLTQTQSLLGTPAYMSPEQMRSAHRVDTRTDIWSLGTVLYELLEGRRPFEAESFSEMCVKVAVDPPGEMTNTPLPVQQIVLRCLAKAPEQRYSSMAELARELVPFSQDPRQAQVLVERMTRMLRRSQMIDWDQARSSIPMQVREIRSMERKAEAAPDAAPDPAISVLDLSEIAAGEPGPSLSPSLSPALSPALSPSPPPESPSSLEPRAAPRRRSRGMILVAAALSGAAALGVVISLSREPAPTGPTAPRERMTVPVPETPVAAPPSPSGPAKLQGSAATVVPANEQADQPSEPVEDQVSPRDRSPTVGKKAARKQARDRPPKPEDKDDARPPCDPFAKAHAGEECVPRKPESHTN